MIYYVPQTGAIAQHIPARGTVSLQVKLNILETGTTTPPSSSLLSMPVVVMSLDDLLPVKQAVCVEIRIDYDSNKSKFATI